MAIFNPYALSKLSEATLQPYDGHIPLYKTSEAAIYPYAEITYGNMPSADFYKENYNSSNSGKNQFPRLDN